MKLHQWVAIVGLVGSGQVPVRAQQPVGVADTLRQLASEPATHTAFTFDKDTLQYANGYLEDNSGGVAGLDSITVENYRYREPAFYIPEEMHALMAKYRAAGWKHLVDQNAGPAESSAPHKPLTDLWLHFNGAKIEDVTVVIRAPKQMNVIEISGMLKPLDLVHLSGHFGIPKIDPGAVMVPESPPGKAGSPATPQKEKFTEDGTEAKSRSVPPRQEARAFVRAVKNWLRQSLQRVRAADRA